MPYGNKTYRAIFKQFVDILGILGGDFLWSCYGNTIWHAKFRCQHWLALQSKLINSRFLICTVDNVCRIRSEHCPELPFHTCSTQQEIVLVRRVLTHWKFGFGECWCRCSVMKYVLYDKNTKYRSKIEKGEQYIIC